MIKLIRGDVNAGFPSPADDFMEDDLHIEDYLVKNQSSTFCVRVYGDSMQGVGIFEGDILVVDASITPRHDDVVIAILNTEHTVKRLFRKGKRVGLKPENPNYQIRWIDIDNDDFRIGGVVTFSLRHHKWPS
ncbi:LexA family protein [Sediminitomix flava]|uniref:DNA polymerase V n=1 Tax=Sediminitomix flava TaxID=379075 RepID=A0A315ZHP7_SEDFL|nr:translesion error-prone DNA polymerase V autoproteolytic subunit [Sediminitomix flava]PWJ44729.1 DNA polymerase V [Sediminitomix flava]